MPQRTRLQMFRRPFLYDKEIGNKMQSTNNKSHNGEGKIISGSDYKASAVPLEQYNASIGDQARSVHKSKVRSADIPRFPSEVSLTKSQRSKARSNFPRSNKDQPRSISHKHDAEKKLTDG